MAISLSSTIQRVLRTDAVRTLGSTTFGLTLLLLILIVAGVGTFFPYETAVERIYRTPWFFALLALLAINHALSAAITLVFHTLPMFRPHYRRSRSAFAALKHRIELQGRSAEMDSGGESVAGGGQRPLYPRPSLISALADHLADCNYTVHRRGHLLYAHRNLWGRFGGTVAHIGLILVIAGGMIQITSGVSGQVLLLEGETTNRLVYERHGRTIVRDLGFDLYLRDFDIGFYPNTRRPQRFISHLDVLDSAGDTVARGVSEVNNAFFFGGWTFHQNSYSEISDVRRYQITLLHPATGRRHVFQITLMPPPDVSFYSIPASRLVFALRETPLGLAWYLADSERLLAQGFADERRGPYTLELTDFAPAFRLRDDGSVETGGVELENPAVEVTLRTGDGEAASRQWLFWNEQMRDMTRRTAGPFQLELEDLMVASSAVGRRPLTATDVKALVRIIDPAGGGLLTTVEAVAGRPVTIRIPAPPDNAGRQGSGQTGSGGWTVERVVPVPAYVSTLGVTTAPGKPIAYMGCLFLVLGIIIGFGVPRRQIWAWFDPESEQFIVGGKTRYYGARLRHEMLAIYRRLRPLAEDSENQHVGRDESVMTTHRSTGVLLIVLALWAGLGMSPASAIAREGVDLESLRTLPVHHAGTLKSFYTFAVEQIRTITGSGRYAGMAPMDLTLSLIWEPQRWAQEPLIRIENKELRSVFGAKRISPADFFSPQNTARLHELFNRNKRLEQAVNVLLYQADSAAGLAHEWRIIPVRTPAGELTFVSPVEFEHFDGEVTEGQLAVYQATVALKDAWHEGDSERFETAAQGLARLVDEELAKQGVETAGVRLDYWYTVLHPFARAGQVYLLALLLFVAGFLLSKPRLYGAGGVALAGGLLVHVAALGMRGWVAGRVPVSNFYESFTFATGAIVFFSLLFQRLFRRHLIGAIGAGLGFIFMGVANALPVRMLRIEPLIPALQSYWLNIHVTTLLLSYAVFSIAFVIGLLYVVQHLRLYGWRWSGGMAHESGALLINSGDGLGGVMNDQDESGGPPQKLVMLAGLNFRLIIIGLVLLTAGVILGAVWADTAWGRPWGWDPKETWAAITWGVYAVAAHLHLFGRWRGLPVVIVSIAGFLCVVFTYVGVSFFLSGLHSYA
ncbi:MAG: hypothetical protein Kow0059_08950 [Candidatus Sumerlaeia bacterium]